MRNQLLAGFVISLLLGCGNGGESIIPERKDLVQTVYASGKVYPIDYVKIASKTNGYITQVFVKPGDSVFKGQALLTIESANSDVSVDIANQQLQYNEAVNHTRTMQLESAWQDVLAAASKYALDSTNMQRYKNLLREDITTRANFDQAQTQADLSWRSLQKAKSNYDQLKLRLSTDVSLAKQQVQFQQNNKSDNTIRAPFSGRIYEVPIKPGQLITSGVQAFGLGASQLFEAWLDIDEADIGMIARGQQVLISLEAYPEKPILTTVREIEPSLTPGNKTIIVKTDLPTNELVYFCGMSAEANITISIQKNVWVVPEEYVDAANMITQKDGTKKKVQTGMRNKGFVEISSGVDASTALIKP